MRPPPEGTKRITLNMTPDELAALARYRDVLRMTKPSASMGMAAGQAAKAVLKMMDPVIGRPL